jgi:hypothetical protein
MSVNRPLTSSGVAIVLGLIGGLCVIAISALALVHREPMNWALAGSGMFLTALFGSACCRGLIWANRAKN